MAYVLDIETTDDYQELECPGTQHVLIQVSNAAISIGFGSNQTGQRGSATYPDDEVLLPVMAGLDRTCDAVRVKSYKPGTPADVKLSANG